MASSLDHPSPALGRFARRASFVLGAVTQPRRMMRALRILHSFEYFEGISEDTMWGSLTAADERQLARAVREAAAFPGPIVEIGCLFGFTTQLIASLKPPDKELITIENFSWNPFLMSASSHREFTRRSLRLCVERLSTRVFDGTNRDFYQSYSGLPPAMVFIDADHTYEGVSEDIEWAMARKVPLITGHDYLPGRHPGVVRAVDERFPGSVDVGGSVWIARTGNAG